MKAVRIPPTCEIIYIFIWDLHLLRNHNKSILGFYTNYLTNGKENMGPEYLDNSVHILKSQRGI